MHLKKGCCVNKALPILMSGQVFVAYGLLVKPSFQKILVHSGAVVKLSISNDGVLLPMSQSRVKSKNLQNGVMISP
jgi:hypothetical protein